MQQVQRELAQSMSLEHQIEAILMSQVRIEEKLDSQQTLCAERRGQVNARIEALQASQTRLGERVGKLESQEDHRAGQVKVFGWVIGLVCSAGSALLSWLVAVFFKGGGQ